jgi:23S rRNA (cytidine1920-2'-O)/16S rRNA (cytidine1409-2'-O)-methyltransferase
MKKIKLDELLVSRGLMPDTDMAKRHIMAGNVLVNDRVICQPGTPFNPQVDLRVKEKKSNFASRGGDKLYHFIQAIDLNPRHRVALDIGISTGGFTDVLLQAHAKHVLGIDVSYGILDYRLRTDPRVSLLERTNARELTQKCLNAPLSLQKLTSNDIQLVVMDVSFISVFKILPNLIPLLSHTTDYIILVKPQFEAERHMIGPGGIVSDTHYLADIQSKVMAQFNALGLNVQHHEKSQLKGTKGNQEYFYWVNLTSQPSVE